MNIIMKHLHILLTAACFLLLLEPSYAQDSTPSPGTTTAWTQKLSSAALLEDAQVLKEVLLALHPGLTRYQPASVFEANHKTLELALNQDLTIEEAYIAFSKFVTSIQCGHTIVNPWNQQEAVKQRLFDTANKLPFTFQLIDRRMIVVRNVSNNETLKAGSEILSIDGIPVDQIVDSLLTVTPADGTNNGKRLNKLQLTGLIKHEYFDIYFPLFFAVKNGTFNIKASTNGKTFDTVVHAITTAERKTRLSESFGLVPDSYDALWELKFPQKNTAYLKLGTFVTWQMEMDWKAFLQDAFAEMQDRKTTHLILDIRGNEGGSGDVMDFLQKNLTDKPVTLKAKRNVVRYNKVPDEIRPYLSTWDEKVFDISWRVVAEKDGFFTSRFEKAEDKTIEPGKTPYTGKLYLLVDAANSSATFHLAQVFKNNDLGTIIGEETGGNLKGTNGGMMFFLNLPNSTIEIDVPIYATYPLTEQPDRGLRPEVEIKQSVEDLAAGKDTVLEYVLNLIQ